MAERNGVRGDAAKKGGLTVVGTPIGNLGDLSPRAREALASADVVCCEDTRVTGRLLSAVGVSVPLLRCDENVIASRTPELVRRMLAGEAVAFASDAGMPGVSDPGQRLVDAAIAAGVPVTVVPGPVACVTALVACGIPCERFFFEGFLPRKSGERERRLRALAPVPGALIFYESPHRVMATLESIASVFPRRETALVRELTKVHEEVVRDLAPALVERLRERESLKGEMVVVVAPPTEEELERLAQASLVAGSSSGDAGGAPGGEGSPSADELLRREILAALEAGEGTGSIAKRLSTRFSRRKREVYELAVSLQDDASMR